MKTIPRQQPPGASPPLNASKKPRPNPRAKRTGLSSKWVRAREDSLELGSWSFLGSISPLLVGALLALWFVRVPTRAADALVGGSDLVECANLIYAGTKSSVCFSEEFLSAV